MGVSLLRRRLFPPPADHPATFVQAHAAVFVLLGRQNLAVRRHPHQPTQHLDVAIRTSEQLALTRRVRRLDQDFEDVQRPIGEALPEDSPR